MQILPDMGQYKIFLFKIFSCLLAGLLFTTSLTIGRSITEMSLSITSGMEISEVEIWYVFLRSFRISFSGTGEGPRATACAFWNEFMPILRKENRTVTIKFESRKDDVKLNHFFGSDSIKIRLDRTSVVLIFLLFLAIYCISSFS